MNRKICVKRLTASDLTFFEWHFRNKNAGNQKAINLNADVFIRELFPALPEASQQTGGRFGLDLHIYGPGLESELNLQRKIIKLLGGAYKNWRLDGEFIYNPEERPERFNTLEPGDIAIMEFIGATFPHAARAVLLARNVDEDLRLHAELERFLGTRSMAAITPIHIQRIVEAATPNEAHPVHELLPDDQIEDAALGGAEGARKLFAKKTKQTSAEDLQRARATAEITGQMGEEFVNDHLAIRKSLGEIEDFTWVSRANAVSPYDFEVWQGGGDSIFIEVKSTLGDFARRIHISLNEILTMAGPGSECHIYRVYEIEEETAKIRVCADTRGLANQIRDVIVKLPEDVESSNFSLSPDLLDFGEEFEVRLDLSEEE